MRQLGLDLSPLGIEQVQPGEKGDQRYRKDKRVRRWLLAKRPPEDATQQIISYRTETCLACNRAEAKGADEDVLDFLIGEYEWALARLRALAPHVLVSLSADD